MTKTVKICKRCVMDNVNTKITFDKNGYCNYCSTALNQKDKIWKNNIKGEKELLEIIKNIKLENKNKKYDCIIGISGGIDSSYLAYYLKKYELRMLGVHIDGGWNTEISENNIKKLTEKLGIDLITIKINENEMYDLQRAYFLSEVINQDVPQDHLFFSVLYRYAIKNNIKYFMIGKNFSSESILPSDWIYNAMDGKNLKDIYKKFGTKRLKEIKPMNFFEIYVYIPYIKRLKRVAPLNYINYDKEKAIEEININLGFEYYGGKHCESSFTRLYQGYILPKKFGVDKTKAHLSSLIVAGQLSRDKALEILKSNKYIGSEQNKKDIEDFILKTKISKKEFDEIMNNKQQRDHLEFKNFHKTYIFFENVIKQAKKFRALIKSNKSENNS